MADEFQLGSLAAEVIVEDDSQANVAAAYAEIVHATQDLFPLQIATVYAETMHRTLDVYETQIGHVFMEVIRSLPDLLLPAGLERPTSEMLWPVEAIESEAPPVPGPMALATSIETNPYRPDVPIHLSEDDPELYEYLREQAELLRQQHNLIQAGDSTYPWEIATTPSLTAEFTLGSMSRFVHATLGLFSARFVQFSADTVQPSLFLGFDRGSVEWVGTNKAKRTSLWRPLGLNLASGSVGGKYGWVLTHGRGPVSITVESAIDLIPDMALTWDPLTPDALTVGPGPEVARILDPSPAVPTTGVTPGKRRWVLPAGTWVLGLNGGITPEYIDLRAASQLVDIEADLAAIHLALEAIESNDFASAIAALQKQQGVFDVRLTNESKSRNISDGNLNRKIETLREALGELQNSFGAGTDLSPVYTALENLTNRVNANRADENARLESLEIWRGEVNNTLASLLASANANLRPVLWAMEAVGTGAPQDILLISNGLGVTDVIVHVNGLKWLTTEYTILEQTLTITTNANGDLIEIIGF